MIKKRINRSLSFDKDPEVKKFGKFVDDYMSQVKIYALDRYRLNPLQKGVATGIFEDIKKKALETVIEIK